MTNPSSARRRDRESNFARYYHAASITGLGFADPEPTRQSWSPLEGLIGTGLGTSELLRTVLDGTSPRIVQPIATASDLHGEAKDAVFPAAAQSARDQVRFIQASLGLTVAQFACALGVERQTIYNWLQIEQTSMLQTRTRTRLAQISDIARQWNQICPMPIGKLAASLDIGGTSLIGLLSQTPINEPALRSAMESVAAHLADTRKLRRGRLRTKAPPPESADDRIRQSATGIPLDLTLFQD